MNTSLAMPITKPPVVKPIVERPRYSRDEIVHADILNADERLWVPHDEKVSFLPLCFGVTQGYYVTLLRVRRSGVLSRHLHTGSVHGQVLKGSWYYLEHDWVAREGSFVMEPPGETHTLIVPPEVPEMMTLFHVTGAYIYYDDKGQVTGHEDVFTRLAKAQRHYEQTGLPQSELERLIR